MKYIKNILATAVTLFMFVGLAPQTAISAPNDFSTFPDQPNDTSGKFINIAGAFFKTPYIPTVFFIALPSDATSFDVEIFDGDMGLTLFPGFVRNYDGNYDQSLGTPYTTTDPSDFSYRLIPDPLKDLSTTTAVVTKSSNDFGNATWESLASARPVDAAAQSPTGNYFYRLEVVYNGDPDADIFLNGYKVRARQNGGSTQAQISVFQQISVVGAPINFVIPDAAIGTPENTYDGNWDFTLVLTEVAVPSVEFRENDADHFADLLPPDNISPGAPLDDNSANTALRISPSIRYEVFDPNNQSIRVETDPSGNIETETFVYAPTYGAPAGGYLWRWTGVDAFNTFSLFADNEFYAINCNRDCLSPLFRVGDFVWMDVNGNGKQDTGESGVGGVTVNLTDATGNVIASTTTSADGYYIFPDLNVGTYTAVIASDNFNVGGPLEDLISTTGGEEITDTIVNADVLSYDFGYIPAAACDGECEGKVTTLTIKYNGTSPTNIEVYQKKISTQLFAGLIDPGDTFIVNGLDKKGTLGTQINIFGVTGAGGCVVSNHGGGDNDNNGHGNDNGGNDNGGNDNGGNDNGGNDNGGNDNGGNDNGG
ncbi:MAG: hypothetical protein GXP09_10905, partial [Gammaproteobacteria bacterium]|nr:hypothetical protein [Gammaproteobacteria bacterium]